LEEDDPTIVQLMLKFMYTGFLDIELQMAPVMATPEAKCPVPQGLDLTQIYMNPYQSYHYPPPGCATNSGLLTYNLASYPGSFPPFNNSTLLPRDIGRPTSTFTTGSGTSNMQDPPLSKPSMDPAPPPENSSKHLAKGLITSAQVYILADKYDVSPLKAMACKIYKHLSKSFWNTEEFIESLTIIFDNTPDTTTEIDMLRATASKEAMTYAKDLLSIASFQELCQERGDIATAVLMASVALVDKDEVYCQPFDYNPGAFFG
jgi:hypothetical protein